MMNKPSHIMIVDDNPENIRVLGTVLRQIDCRLTIAQNGLQALKAVKDNIPDLILLDIMMPEMDGFQVCEVLKADPSTQDIEIIFVTAAVEPSDELKGLKLGAVDYIHKPFSIPLVRAKVALHLERANSKKQLQLKNAALEENAKLREHIDRITRHDLKNPLNALLGYPQLMLLDKTLNATQRGYLENMITAGNEMLHMINSSLDLFKMETRCYQYKPQVIDMVSVIRRILKDLRTLIRGFSVTVKILVDDQEDYDDKVFMILAEQNLSYSLFANLIRNAIEACTVADSEVIVAMKYIGNEAVITVTNPGSVPEEVRATFFDKYSTAGKTHGTGLGSYSAKLMTETQHGRIDMATSSAETCITVWLPKPN